MGRNIATVGTLGHTPLEGHDTGQCVCGREGPDAVHAGTKATWAVTVSRAPVCRSEQLTDDGRGTSDHLRALRSVTCHMGAHSVTCHPIAMV